MVRIPVCTEKRRNKSAPGPDRIPYVEWKFCPCLHSLLCRLITRVWSSASIPRHWQVAVVTLLAKSDITADPKKFRPIALAHSLGKIFFSILGNRLLRHMKKNDFFDGIAHKGFLPGVSGCLEHSTMCYGAMRDAKLAKRQICIAWVDLRNAFGSVRHNLIQFALRHYKIPFALQKIIFTYYSRLSAFVLEPRTEPFNYGLDVFQGCT